MTISRFPFLIIASLVLVASLACSQSSASPQTEAPPTPAMPANWNIVSDINFSAADIRPVGANLGASISALRNTTYEVGSMRIKLNTIVATTSNDADSIMLALGKMKPGEWFLCRELLIYEFVGSNDAIPEMRKGRAMLAQR